MIILDINTKKNLLAFSCGVDSTALFFLLLKENINFDIAIVNYNVRTESSEEVSHAKALAKKYNKKCFIKEVTLIDNSNFEKVARDIRYSFFEELIGEHKYESLLTAHQLNDCLEWFLMQLAKGAGLAELIGLQELELKENYILHRPLLKYDKKELFEYLTNNNIKYFVDKTNLDTKYTRNRIRANFSNKFIDLYKSGIQKSFMYLKEDLNSLNIDTSILFKEQKLEIFQKQIDNNINIRIIDKVLKRYGILISSNTREEILKQKEIVVSHKISISITNNHIWVCPYIQNTMQKKFKDICRLNKIPKNTRSYIYSISEQDTVIRKLSKYI